MKTNLTLREKKVFFFYNYFLNNFDKTQSEKTLLNDKLLKLNINSIEKIEHILEVKNDLINTLSKGISDFYWNDINPIEKAILINALYEINYLKISKKIVINEYVELSKKYGTTEKSYGFINSILDKF